MNPLATICGAAMALSYVLPWIEQPGLGAISPRNALPPISLDMLQASPPMLLAFLATFALGALVALMALFGLTLRFLTVVAGLLPFGLITWLWLDAADMLRNYGLPTPSAGDVSELIDRLRDVAAIGLYAWIGGAAGLVLAFLFPVQRQ